MQICQALRPGARLGISGEPRDDGHWTEQTWRAFEAVDHLWREDLEPVARLGRLVGRDVDGGGQTRSADNDAVLTGRFRDTVLAFLPHPGLGEGNDVLLRACHGQGSTTVGWSGYRTASRFASTRAASAAASCPAISRMRSRRCSAFSSSTPCGGTA